MNTAVDILVVMMCAGILYYALPLLYAIHARNRLEDKLASSGCVVLTFDDGPSMKLTTEILDLLNAHHLSASFFLLGRHVQSQTEIVKRIAREGHHIGSHGYDHVDHTRSLPWTCIRDIRKGWEAINAALGKMEKHYPFRPVRGKLNLVSLIWLWVHRVPIIYWTFDSGDTWSQNPTDIERISRQIDQHNGDVVLLHDFERKNPKNHQFVIDALHAVIEKAEKKHIQIKPLCELTNQT